MDIYMLEVNRGPWLGSKDDPTLGQVIQQIIAAAASIRLPHWNAGAKVQLVCNKITCEIA